MDLSKVGAREKLKPKPGKEPHWQRLQPGCFLGYRPSAREGVGTWITRTYDEDDRRYRVKSMGDFGALPPSERFLAAKREAEAFADLVESGGQVAQRSVLLAKRVERMLRATEMPKGGLSALFMTTPSRGYHSQNYDAATSKNGEIDWSRHPRL